MATSYLRLIANTNHDTSGASAGWITFQGNSGTDLIYALQNGSLSNPSLNSTKKGAFRPSLGYICAGGCDYNGGISSWTPNLRNVLNFNVNTQADLDEINALLVGKTVEMTVIVNITMNGITYDFPLFYFYKQNFPTLISGNMSVISERCLTELPSWGTGTFNCSNVPVNDSQITSIKSYDFNVSNGVQECDDLRSSSGTSEFLITLNGQLPDGTDDSKSYNLLIQPDSQHVNGTVSLSSADGIYTAFKKFYGASVRMLDDVCAHGVGYIDIYGDVVVSGFGYQAVADVYLPIPINVNRQNVLLLRARFDDECCCDVTGYTDEVTDILNDAFADAESYDSSSIMLSYVQPKSIYWSGFSRLVDECCDGIVCGDDDGHDFDIEYPSDGSGGGGDNVDISCICDNLSLINDTLSAFRRDNKSALDTINGTLSQLNIDVDNECICDNLESIKDSIDDVKDSIDNKDLSVDNNVTVQPCTPVVTNPVNNITVQPSNPTITVEPCTPTINVQPSTPVVTNPVNNITVQPSTPTINVEPCTPTINNNVQTDVQDIVDKLDELFKSDDDTITDIIKDKEMGSNIDVEVSPADDVNINRVYYTNQRNGDTNI